MAGTPQKRAKREAQRAQSEALPHVAPPPLPPTTPASIPDATRARDARTRARPMPPTQTRAPAMGRSTHATIDEQQARAVRGLASFIKPGLTLRLSRTRPTWAMGFIEDYPVNDGESLSAFLEYVRDTHGGQTYKVEVLGAGDVQMFEGGISIAGPVRVDGRVVNRAKFEGRDDEREQRAATRGADDMRREHARDDGSMMTFVKMFMDQQRETNAAQLATVSGLVADTRKQTTELLGALAQRDTNNKPDSFTEQLGKILDATTALDTVRKRLTPKQAPAERAPVAGDDDDDDDMKLATRELKKVFMRNVAEHLVRPPAAPGAASQAPRRAPAAPPERPKTRAPAPGFIPDAQSTGRQAAEN